MKSLFRVPLFAAGVFFSLDAMGGNLIPNGDLANVTWAAGGLPKGVSFSADTSLDGPCGSASVVEVPPGHGTYALCIERSSAKGNSRLHFGPFPVQPGKRYYFSCREKSTAGAAGVLFDLSDAARKGVSHVTLEDAVSTNPDVLIHGNGFSLPLCLADQPDGFNRMDETFTIPPGVCFLTISLNFSWVKGTAWFNDIQLLPLDAATSP